MTDQERYVKGLESALKVIWVWAKNNDLDRASVMKLCDNALPKMLHEQPGVRRRRLTSDPD
jgi:hypothetical protein